MLRKVKITPSIVSTLSKGEVMFTTILKQQIEIQYAHDMHLRMISVS